MPQLLHSYLREAHRLRRQLELSQTKEEICQSDNFAYTPVGTNRNSNPIILFTQSGQSQEHGKETRRKGVQNCDISLEEEETGCILPEIRGSYYESPQHLRN